MRFHAQMSSTIWSSQHSDILSQKRIHHCRCLLAKQRMLSPVSQQDGKVLRAQAEHR
jgi:hypothetical protein